MPSESKIQENKDWNMVFVALSVTQGVLGEQDPRKQGLKLGNVYEMPKCSICSESKIQENKDWNLYVPGAPGLNVNSESKIQENKDWNYLKNSSQNAQFFDSESKIQENKDWNYQNE